MCTSPLRALLQLAWLCSLLLAGCSGGTGERRSAILITLDTTRWDALGAHGVHPRVTPRLDELAREAVLYEFAHSVAPLTLPSHASMLTGLYPPRHTIRDNGFQALPASASTLAESAQEKGIQTAAFVASAVLDEAFGLHQGFDTFSAPARPQRQLTTHFAERKGAAVVEDAVDWLAKRDRGRPFFLWVHLFDPHDPYEPPARFLDVTEEHPAYYGEVALVDEAVGVLLDALRREGTIGEATLLIVADHGESLMEHREATHSHFCYQPTVRVPFLLRYADGFGAGERSSEVVSVVDVYPTLMEAMRLSNLSDHDGHSLYKRSVPGNRAAYFESYSGYVTFGWSPIAGCIDAQGKYIHSSAPEFYDVRADPDELHNLLPEGEHEVAPYRRLLADMVVKPALVPDGETQIDASITEAIQGLGYTASGPMPTPMPHPLADTGLPSPASMVDTFHEYQRALSLIDAGRLPEAIQLFQEILEDNPRNWMVLERLGVCYVNLHRPADAIAPLELVAAEGPQRAGTYYNLAVSYYGVGEQQRDLQGMSKGVETLRHAIELDPTEPHFRQGLQVMLDDFATALRQMGRHDDAQDVLEELKAILRAEEEGA